MAGKAKSVYLTVVPKGMLSSVFYKIFFDVKAYNDYVKSAAFMEKYPTEQFQILKEIY